MLIIDAVFGERVIGDGFGKVYGYSSGDLDINPTVHKGFLREATWASTWGVFDGKGRGEKGKDNK